MQDLTITLEKPGPGLKLAIRMRRELLYTTFGIHQGFALYIFLSIFQLTFCEVHSFKDKL